MNIKIELDMHNEDDRTRYEQFVCMRRNQEFWNQLYDKVFRHPIKYGMDEESIMYSKVWDSVTEYMEGLNNG